MPGKNSSFDLCRILALAFFPNECLAMPGTYDEISRRGWSSCEGEKIWDDLCLAGENAGF